MNSSPFEESGSAWSLASCNLEPGTWNRQPATCNLPRQAPRLTSAHFFPVFLKISQNFSVFLTFVPLFLVISRYVSLRLSCHDLAPHPPAPVTNSPDFGRRARVADTLSQSEAEAAPKRRHWPRSSGEPLAGSDTIWAPPRSWVLLSSRATPV